MAQIDPNNSEEELPGLQTDSNDVTSESSGEEYVPPPRRRCRKKHKQVRRRKPARSHRSTKRQTSAKKCTSKNIVARNTTFASKLQCLDVDAIKEFLATADCGCAQKCIRKLNQFKNEGAVDAVYALREARFSGTFVLCNLIFAILSFRYAWLLPPW